MVVYTGPETKIRLNNGQYTLKLSRMERDFNKMVLAFLLVIFVLMVIFSSLLYVDIATKGINMTYVYPEG